MNRTITINKTSIIVAAVGALVLIALGAAAASGGPASSQASPVVVTETPAVVTATPEAVEIATEVTSQDCIQALDEAEMAIDAAAEIMFLFSDFASVASEAVTAAALWDTETIDALTVEIDQINADMDVQSAIISSNNYATPASACRSGA